jgi:hypothetical protein
MYEEENEQLKSYIEELEGKLEEYRYEEKLRQYGTGRR